MTTDRPAATAAAVAIDPILLSHSVRQRIFLYLGVLIVLLAFGAPFGGLIDIPISFFLKNKLHLEAHEVAVFRLVSAIPLYLSCVFGFIRDTWNPLGMRDRGFMVVFGAISAGLYAVFAFTPITYATLLVAVMLLTTSFLFVASAQNGLTSTIGQQHAMSGQISAAWNIFLSVPALAAFLIGGHLSDLLEQPEHRSGRPHSVSPRCRDHGLRGRLRRVETQQRVRQCPQRAGDRSAPHRETSGDSCGIGRSTRPC